MNSGDILKTKRVSVWGLGYLGYTTMLKLQNSGFHITAYDLNQEQLRLFASKRHPNKGQKAVWTRIGYLPKLDYSKINVAKSPRELFKSSHLHIIVIPEFHNSGADDNIANQLAGIFAQNLKGSKIKPLIIFQSAFVPGHIEKNFIEKLRKYKLSCPKCYYLGVLFRPDWSIESFIGQKEKMPIAGYCAESLRAMEELFEYLEMPVVKLNNLKEAEIYINSLNALQAMVSDFMRQLALGYPSVNIKELSKVLFKNITFQDCAVNIGTGGERMTYAIDNLIRGSNSQESLTLLKEFQNINVSSVLNYAEFIIRHSYKSVAILGITYKGDQKDLVLSPSITLADYLARNSVKVSLNDPFYNKRQISKLVKGARVVQFPEGAFSHEVLILASDHKEYKYIFQSTVDKLKKKTKLIIDNYGIWSHLKFDKGIKYHCLGDGSLNFLR